MGSTPRGTIPTLSERVELRTWPRTGSRSKLFVEPVAGIVVFSWNTSDSICFNWLLFKTRVGPLRNELFSGVARSAVFWAFSPSNSLWEWGSSFISSLYYLLWLTLICYVCIYTYGFMPLLFYMIPMCWQTCYDVKLLISTWNQVATWC